ncbi:lysozyme inhibitor LprI family protein, partial [Vibrio cholerae]
LTRQRTYEIWKNFLTYMDSTAPVLPEPSME